MKRRYHSLALLIVFLSGFVLGCGLIGGSDGNGIPRDALVVRMLYGSEKEAWIEAVTPEFNNQRNQTSTGKTIYVDAVAMGSGESLDQILAGTETPAVWSPASSILVPIANQAWASANGGQQLTEANPPPVVLSPVVIAMWQPMAEALGWPNDPISWAEIAEITRSGQTWADFGHPEWGAFQFGHTHPDYSNSGIASILAIAYAATGKTRDLTVADVQDPATAEFMRSVEQGVIHYGRSTGFFGRQMFNRGPAYLSAAVLYENLVVEAYDKATYPNLPLPVVAIYPQEGTFWTDHPYAILNGPWMTDELREASEIYRDYLLAPAQQQHALEFGFRPADTSIPIVAPLTPENGVDPQEPKTLLAVPDADAIRAVRDLWGETKKRVEVQIVLDVSGSMNDEGRLVSAKQALSTFLDQLSDQDKVGVITFSSTASELTPLTELGPKRQEMREKIDALFANGGTRLIDTVVESYQQLQQEPAGERIRAMVVLSDGADNESFTRPEDLAALLRVDESGQSIKVFTIAYGSGEIDKGLLETISEASGARSYESSSEASEIEQVYRDIATFF